MGAYTFDTTAANNTSVGGVGSQGSNRANNIDDLVRALAAAMAAFVRDLGGANTVGGTGDAATVTLADPTTATAYFDGMLLSYRVAADNTITAPTLQVDGIASPKTIKKSVAGVESALAVGDLKAGSMVMVVYRSSWASAAGAFELLNPATLSPTAIELGHASDTTLSRGAAGRVDIEGGAGSLFLAGLELGHASDTTLSRGAAGFMAVEGKRVPSPASQAQYDMLVRGATEWERLAIGTAGQLLVVRSGTPTWSNASTFDSVKTAAGAVIDFTSIPSWVREIDIIFHQFSCSTADYMGVQLGDSGGLETSGYVSTQGYVADFSAADTNPVATSAFYTHLNSAADYFSGIMQLKNITGNVWVQNHVGTNSTEDIFMGAGTKTLSATLDRIRILTSGAGVPDSGTVNICYR
jgi:hypothetical protein